ncbi:MAG: branched-chain amino acid ABC transporter substrate-binding protein [Magnetospirillum sp. WYHS-4]
MTGPTKIALATAFALTLALPARADIAMALVGPLTGSYASVGEQLRRGAEQAVEDINAAGGILGQKVTLKLADDVCDPKQGVAVANKLAAEGVSLVVGHFCSGVAIPASDVYAEENMVLISPGATAPKLTGRGMKTLFRTCGNDDQQGLVAGSYIAAKFPGARVAILHDKQVATKGQADETRAQLHRLGVKEMLYDAVTHGEKDFHAVVTRLKAEQVDLLFYGGYHTEAGLILRQMRETGTNAVLMGGDALMTQELWSIAGPAAEGALMVFSPDPRRNASAKPVVERFRKSGYEPEGYTLYTYAAFQAYAQAMAQAKTSKSQAVGAALHAGKFDTVLGPLSFDAKGDVVGETYTVYRWSNGTYDYAPK